jgi:hypothetical protein
MKPKPLQFGLGSVFMAILAVALCLGAWQSSGVAAAIVWLCLEVLFGALAVEAAAAVIPRIIEARLRLGDWSQRLLGH